MDGLQSGESLLDAALHFPGVTGKDSANLYDTGRAPGWRFDKKYVFQLGERVSDLPIM